MATKKTDKLAKFIADAELSSGKKPTSNNGKEQKVTEYYLDMLQKHQKELGKEKLTVWMQVGSFFEVYGIKWPDGGTLGNVWQVAADLDIKIARKEMTVYGNSEIEVYMAGVKEEYAEPYLERLVDAQGWTVAVYVQAKLGNTDQYERVLKNIISPGINFESDSISNVFMYIYMKGTRSRITAAKTALNIGVYFVDCISGANGSMELFSRDIQEYNVAFSELVKLITIKNPAEIVIHMDIPEIEQYRQFSQQELYVGLTLFDKNVKLVRTVVDSRLKSVGVQEDILGRAYCAYKGKQSIKQMLGLDGQFEFGRLAMCLALEYIFQHDTNIIKLLERPEVLNSSSHYLMLANNCLQQLDVIDITSRTRISQLSRDSELIESGAASSRGLIGNTSQQITNRKITLLELLDKTKTVIGRRLFRQRLSTPITNVDELNTRYSQLADFQAIQRAYITTPKSDWVLSPICRIRSILSHIKDLPKFMRKMATDKLVPMDIDGFIHSMKYTQELWHALMAMDSDVMSGLSCIPSVEHKVAFESLVSGLETSFNLPVCNSHWNNIENNIWLPGVSTASDNLARDIVLDKSFFETLKQELSGIVEKGLAKQQAAKPVSGKKRVVAKPVPSSVAEGEDEADEDTVSTNYVNEDSNVKLGRYLWVNDKNYAALKEADQSTVINIAGSYTIKLSDIEFLNIKKGRWQVRTNYLYLSSKNLTDNIDRLRKQLKQEFSAWQTEFYSANHGIIARYVDFVGEIDVIQSCVYVADKYGYVRPDIIEREDENRSYLLVKAIRHPIVERIRTDTRYVTNDLDFGIPGQDGMLLFGINSSGKSTSMKAVGCCLIMAQAGMFVPATKFTYWPYQYLFTRIRNNDDIYAGLSSFEVEMKEFKVILKYSNENSMILGDELCSGTETLDATALVASGLQQLCKRRANFIFATHLHFLSELKEVTELPNMKFYHLSVRADSQNPDKLIYDRKLAVGNGPQSYGIVVCKSMALDTEFVREAERIRLAIERGDVLGHIKFTPRQTAGASRYTAGASSKYNTEKRFGACEVCNNPEGSDIHHINQQCNADSRGIISSDTEGVFHKNSKWNLVCLCKECHQAVHSNPPTLQIKGYIQTSTGIELKFRKLEPEINESQPINLMTSTNEGEDIREAMIISMYRNNRTFRAIQRKVNEIYGSKIKLTEIECIVKKAGLGTVHE